MQNEILKIKNLSFSYKKEKYALFDISFSVKKGEFILLAGNSGSGKTTLLKLLKPIISPLGEKNGSILFENKDLFTLSQSLQAQKIGYVPQNPENSIVTDEVWHELAFGLENLGVDSNTIRSRVAEISAFFGIEDWFLKKTSDLSGGQKQLLSLASVMVMQPDILILDEPTNQLDPIASREFVSLLSRINKELGTTVILSEHRLEEVYSISDRIIILEDGKIISDASPRETGFNLKKASSKMYQALPVEVRCFCDIEKEGDCPVNIKEGQMWLSKKDIVAEIKEKVTDGKKSDFALKAEDIYFRYEKNERDILRGFSISVQKGEFYAILGSNGSGKTTALNALCKVLKIQEGTLNINGKIACLPQDPQIVFETNSVYEDLQSVLSEESNINDILNIASLCGITHILSSHPYDISGGEQQRAALAKILLQKPDIVLLDEPTKGLDAHFKAVLGRIISNLKEGGKTIICVSHDIEFCAEFADRCALFFDGKIITQNEKRAFFKEKTFYKTSAGRIAQGIVDNIVTKDDIIYVLTGKKEEKEEEEKKENKIEEIENTPSFVKEKKEIKKPKKAAKKIRTKNVFLSALSLVIFILTTILFKDRYEMYTIGNTVFQGVSILELFFVFYFLLPQKTYNKKMTETKEIYKAPEKKAIKNIFLPIVFVIAVILTVISGIYIFDNRKYYFISLAVILELFLFFVYSFDKKENKTKKLVMLSVVCAIGVMGRIVFAPFAQFKPVCAIVIIAGSCFGAGGGFLSGAVIAFVSNMYFSQGPWTPWQMLSFGIIGFVSGILFKKLKFKSNLAISLYGFFATVLIYGGITNPSSILIYEKNATIKMLAASYLPGLPLDIVHGISTFFFLWFLYHPMKEKIERVKNKYLS